MARTYKSSDNFAEYDVFLVKPTSLGEKDVELRTIGVRSVIGHGYPSCTSVRQDEIFIVKTLSVNALA